ncbi:hypothetical protein ABPG74_020885 [Tetrahymena malaccensis]
MIQDFAQNLFEDQIYNSKNFNLAIVQQINSQVQKIAWHLNMLTQLEEKQLQSQVRVNNNFKPALLYSIIQENNDNKQLITIFKKSPLLVSSWIQPNHNLLQQLNETSKQQLYLSSRIDFILKSIKYDDNQHSFRWLQFTTIFFGFSSDGMLQSMGTNTTIKGYVVPPGCPYNDQPFLLDIRCRFYYQPTVNNISITVFPPTVNINQVQYFATNICQRVKKYSSQDPNSDSSIYGIVCSTLNLKLISTYFVNFSKNSIYQRLLDPRQLSLVYDSNLQINKTTLLQDVETNYLQNQQQAQYYLEQIMAHSKFVLQETDNINLSNPFYNSLNTFQYNRNGTECFVILNSIQMIDKIPKQETQKSINPAKKYQLKNVYLFMDVLSKQNMLVYAQNLEDTIIFYNKIFLYTSWGIIFLILFVQIIYSIQIGFSILEPVIHLRNIIDQIKILNQKQPKQQSILISNRTLSDVEDEILIDDQLDRDFDGYCLSSETQDLLNSFQSMFQTLKFTTKKLFGDNQSTSLLNLNDQLSHFKQFGNLRALGICYNNIGVIHFNSQRYQEALENFGNSLVYSKYELGTYFNEETDKFLNSQLYNFKIQFKAFLLNFINQQQNQLLCDIKLFVVNYKEQNQISYLGEDVEYLFQNLFNRNINYQIAQISYLKEQNFFLWDSFEDRVIENIAINLLYLSPSDKREISSYCNILQAYFNLNTNQQINGVLNIITQYYLNLFDNHSNKSDNSYSTQYNKDKFLNQILGQFEHFADSNSIYIKKHSKNLFESIIITSPMKTQKLQKATNNYEKQLESNENIINPNKSKNSSISRLKTQSIQQQIIYKKMQQNYMNQSVNKNQKVYQKKKSQNINQSYDSSPKMLQGIEISNQSLLQKDEIKESVDIRKYSNFTNLFNNSIHKSISIQSKQESFQKYPHTFQRNNKIFDKNLNNFINLLIYLNQTNQLKQLSLNKVRKYFKEDKQNIYDYSSDVYFQQFTIQQANFQISQQNYYTAALILVKNLEECKYYLPYLKKIQINLLTQIFQENKIQCAELQEIKNKYDTLTNCNFNVFIISTSYNKFYQKKLCALCFDLINQVLFKEEDSFGLLNFNFEEQIFIQNIGVTFIKTISSNIQLFYEIFMELFLKKDSQQQQVNITEQKQLGISQQTEFIKESHNRILNRQNSIQQREKQYSKCYQDSLKNKGVPSPENQNFQQKQDEQPTEYSVISLFNTEPFEKLSDHSLDIKEDGSKSYENGYHSDKEDEILQKPSNQFTYFENQSYIQKRKNMFTISQTNNFKQGVETKNSFEFSDSSNNEMHNLIRNSQEDTVISCNSYKQNKNQINKIARQKQNYYQAQNYKSKSEQVFIQGVLACLKQFVFNFDEKLATFMAQYKFRNQNQNCQINKNSQTYLIYFTDQKLNLTNKTLIEKLKLLLINMQLELIILNQNQSQSLEEKKIPQDITENGRKVITFFSSEEKLLQYIYNSREHIKNCYQTTIVEHF